jgi:GTP-binding protein EngB required for normal cell division
VRWGRSEGPTLAERLSALDEVVSLARGRLDETVVAGAARVAGKAGQRLRLGADLTVVALAGATGSGKSSLLNALAGSPVSTVGVRRPTTATATAVVWGQDGAGDLLDWLEVPRRHAAGTDLPLDGLVGADGLVLLDLPDFDSVRLAHRLEVDRLVELVDLLVWVVDPQKYADAALHDRYLRPLSGHAGVMLVVLNQVDRLDPAAREACLADLRRLLDREGLGQVPVLAASARTGEGLPELRQVLGDRAAARRAAVQRLEADLQGTAAELGRSCAAADGGSGKVRREDRSALVDALADAAGAETIANAVARSHRARAVAATGWPFTRWLRRLRPDPVRRLGLPPTPNELVRTGLPGPSAVQRARVDSALRTLTDHATRGMPEPWPGVVRRVAVDATAELPELLDRTVAGTDLGIERRPRWWMLAGLLQAVLAAAAVAGALWLLALFVLDWLRLPDPPMAHVGQVPLPTVLLVGGVLAGLLLALLSRRLAAAGARRRARTARRRIGERVEQVADERVLAPVEAELAARRQLCEAVGRLAR